MSICAACQAPSGGSPCVACGAEPRLDGRYTLVGLLGAGGTSTTWRAQGPRGEMAIKELSLRRVRGPKARELVDREIRVLSELHIPAVPRLHEVIETGRGRSHTLWLVMDLAPGLPLHRAFEGPISETRVLVLVARVAQTLGALHALRPAVLHRDVKPHNLILDPDSGAVRLVDFGSVRDVVREPGHGSTVVGTFGYLAPEQLLGDACPASDFYGLGATAVHLLIGGSPHALLNREGHLRWRDGVHASIGTATLLDALLEPDPAQRLSDAAEVLRMVNWIHGLGRNPRRPSSVPRLRADQGLEEAPPRQLRELVQRMGTESFGQEVTSRSVPPAASLPWPSSEDEADLRELLEDAPREPLERTSARARLLPRRRPAQVALAVGAMGVVLLGMGALGFGVAEVLRSSPSEAPLPVAPAPVSPPVVGPPTLNVDPSQEAISRSLVDLHRSLAGQGCTGDLIRLEVQADGAFATGRGDSYVDVCAVRALERLRRTAPWPLVGRTWVLPPTDRTLTYEEGRLQVIDGGARFPFDPVPEVPGR